MINFRNRIALAALLGLGLSAGWAIQAAASGASQPPPLVSKGPALVLPVIVRPATVQTGPSLDCVVTRAAVIPITALAFSPDGKTLAVGGYREVVLWDLAGVKLARRIAIDGYVGAVAFLPNGTLVVGAGTPYVSGTVRFLDPATGKETGRLSGPEDVVISLAVAADGKLLAASAAGKVAYVWNVAQNKLVTRIEGHSDRILHVAFSPDGKFLTTCGADNAAQVCSVGDWTSVARFTEAYAVRGSAFHSDDVQVLLAIGGPDGSGLRFRKTDALGFRRPIPIGAAIPLGMVGPSKTGRVYVPCTDKTVKVFDIRSGGQLATLNGHQDWVHAVALSSDETKFASASADGTIKLWNALDNRLLATLVQLAPRADDWLILAAQGYVATSSPAALAWKADKLTMPPDQLTAKLQDLEKVGKAIAGEKLLLPVLK